MRFSVVIPTYNRARILEKTLNSIELQIFPKSEFEVVVVDDGSTDVTKSIVENFQKTGKVNTKYFFQKNQGAGAARNLGIENAAGEIILFAGDDMIFDERLLEQHDRVHRQTPDIAVLGMAFWDESGEVNDFMRYIAPNGPQFHFGAIKNIEDAGWHHFYTCNISLSKKTIGDLRFDPRFTNRYMALEDIDFGLSLAKRGVKIFFNKDAIVYHSHFYTPEIFRKRMITVGRSFVVFIGKHKNNLTDSWRLKWRYAPFTFLPFQLELFVFLSRVLAESNLVKKISIKAHWFFDVCHCYSSAIKEEKKIKTDVCSREQ